MMRDGHKVHVKFFAIFREYVGLKEDWAEIEPGMTVEDLWLRYAQNAKNPRVANIRAAYSVNQRLAKADTKLQGGEEVGFLPPVSGGAKSKRRDNTLVTSRALRLSPLIKKVERPGAGAIVTFTGVVRDNAHDRRVKYLEYEAYDELAAKTIEEVCQEATRRWPEVRIAAMHRTGHLDIGEASVMIAASSPHRAEAFAACRYAIERIKAILPVWKKEFASDEEYWVEGPLAGEISPEEAEEVVREAEEKS